MPSKNNSRRKFIKNSALASSLFIVPRNVLGGEGFIAPSDKINIAGIGLHGQGQADVSRTAASKYANIVALCDVHPNANGSVAIRNKFPDAEFYIDYREMIDKNKDIDAVIVTTPDHTHANIAEFELSLKNSSRGACGVLAVPYFNGERTPNLAGGKACLFGLDGQNMQRENFFRAVVEGVSFGLYYGLERMAEQGICAKEIVLTGGGSNSQIWRQIVADICNVNVSVPKQQETAAFGAALQALAIISEEELEEIAQEHVKTDQNAGNKPDPESVDFYREHYQSYLDAAAHVATIYERKAAE